MTFDFSLRRTLVTARTHAQNQVQKPVVKNNYREEPDGKTDTTDRITIIAKWEFIGFQWTILAADVLCIHWVKWRHIVYGHNTVAILWV